MTRDDLIAFEDEIAALFNAGKIRHPIHLESGNEDQLLEVFRNIKHQDWVFTSRRGHLKALLKGVPPEELRAAIFRGESMTLRFPEQRVYGSAIVGGTVPIALGVSMAIWQRGGSEGGTIPLVHCFLGERGLGEHVAAPRPGVREHARSQDFQPVGFVVKLPSHVCRYL